jgi:polyphosphate kinase
MIDFERRVLEEARDQRNPLLERVKFLGILGNNIDELVMVRGREWADAAGAKKVARKTHALLRNASRLLHRELLPALAAAGVHLADYASLTAEECAEVDRLFVNRVLPLIVPIALGETPLARVPALGLNLAVAIDGARPLAIVRVPDGMSSLVPASDDTFVWLHQVIAANVHRLFPGARIQSVHAFRILRDADIVLDAAHAGELPARTVDAVRQRETNPVRMLVIDRAAPQPVVDRLTRALAVDADASVRAREVFDFKRLWDVAEVPRADLRYPDFVPRRSMSAGSCVFAAMRVRDILLHHPFESFQPVIDLVRQAAADPAVERMSATLYRTDRGESPIVEALVDAARRGKDVRVIVELKARFDERHNAEWARTLTAAGAKVVHAPAGLKVHAKLILIERREGSRLRRYAHVSTGNYSSVTSQVYTDFGLLTCDDAMTADIAELVDFMRGEVPVPILSSAMVAPFGLRAGLRALVEREMAWAERGEAAHVILKMNALLDQPAIDLLERASRAGVQVDLIVRGASALIPATSRIRIRSIVGRFLEHSRAWYFRNGGAEELFIGSADLRPRNFDKRVEVVVPVKDRALAHRLRYEILDTYLADNLSARELMANGRYRRVSPRPGEPGISCQAAFLESRSPGAMSDDTTATITVHRTSGAALLA